MKYLRMDHDAIKFIIHRNHFDHGIIHVPKPFPPIKSVISLKVKQKKVQLLIFNIEPERIKEFGRSLHIGDVMEQLHVAPMQLQYLRYYPEKGYNNDRAKVIEF